MIRNSTARIKQQANEKVNSMFTICNLPITEIQLDTEII
jgi:hypothetical protein